MSAGGTTLGSRVAMLHRSRLTAIAGSILGTQVVTSALGFVFWTVAARGMPPAVLGRLGSATAAALLLSTFGLVGCGTLLISRLGSAAPAEQRRLLVTTATVGPALTALLACLFGIGAWLLLPAFSFLIPTGATFWWLVAAAALTTLGGVFDEAMLVLGRPATQVVRNGVASGLKVVLLGIALLAGYAGVSWALAAWVVGQLASCALAARAAWRLTRTEQRVTAEGMLSTIRRHWREATHHHGMNVALAAPSALQPVIIAAAVSAEANALFTTVRLVSAFAFLAPYALAMALFAASAGEPAANRRRIRAVFRVSLSLSLVLYAVLFVGAPLILSVFGKDYATGSDTYLRIIGLACPLLVVKDQYIAEMRSARTSTRAMPYVLVSTTLEVAGTLLGATIADLTGALVGWLAALALGAVWVVTLGRRSRAHPPPRHAVVTAESAPSTSAGAAR
jgi:O-antigen/teichoic acid export membrane protein